MTISEEELTGLVIQAHVAALACEELERLTGTPKESWLDKFLVEIVGDKMSEQMPDARNYIREFIESTADCQPCEGTGEVIRQSQTVPCPNCGGAGWQSRTSNYYEES